MRYAAHYIRVDGLVACMAFLEEIEKGKFCVKAFETETPHTIFIPSYIALIAEGDPDISLSELPLPCPRHCLCEPEELESYLQKSDKYYRLILP